VAFVDDVTSIPNVSVCPGDDVAGTSTSVVQPPSARGAARVVPAPATPIVPTRMTAAASGRRHRDLRMFGLALDLSADTVGSSRGGWGHSPRENPAGEVTVEVETARRRGGEWPQSRLACDGEL